MNMQDTKTIRMSENVILVDADYIDYVAFQLSVQFERMIGRRIPQADLSQWAVNIALDGGLRPDGQNHETQVVLVHDQKQDRFENFHPSHYSEELDAQAFKDEQLGEFLINAYAVGEVLTKDDYLIDVIKTVCEHSEVKRLMIIPNAEQGESYARVSNALRDAPDDKRITVFTLQPMEGGNFRQEILGYSVMNALGISSSDLDIKN